MIRIEISTERSITHYTSPFVSSNEICESIPIKIDDQRSNWKPKFPHLFPYIFWFICDAKNKENFNEPTNTVTFNISSEASFRLIGLGIYLVEPYDGDLNLTTKLNGHWIDDLNFTLNDYKDVERLTETIKNKTGAENAINSNERMAEILDIIEKQQFFVENSSDIGLTEAKARDYATKSIEIFSNLFDQSQAWDNSTVEQKTNISSRILSAIHNSSFTLAQTLSNENRVEKITCDHIYLSTFIVNSSQEIIFPDDNNDKNGSIKIPKINLMNVEKTNRNLTAVSAIINKLQTYLLGGMNKKMKINSMILSFSLFNQTGYVKVNGEFTIM
jgi:hypothetical protein